MADTVFSSPKSFFNTVDMRPSIGVRYKAADIEEYDLSPIAEIERFKFSQESLVPYPIDLTRFRRGSDLSQLPPAVASDPTLAIVGGTFGTNSPSLRTEDAAGLGPITRRATVIAEVPESFDEGQDFQVRVSASMQTISDTTATVDVEMYSSDTNLGLDDIGDLITTAATSINSASWADYNFSAISSGLIVGSILIIRVSVAVNDAATGSGVIARLGSVDLLMDAKI